jgi:predicted patatin/cPLA2 family phospholipase
LARPTGKILIFLQCYQHLFGEDTSCPARHRWLCIALLFLLSGCAIERVSPPPAGEPLRLPWGAVNVQYTDDSSEAIFSDDALRAAAKVADEYRRSASGDRIPYRILALSGGGSRGAYGAGVLAGWTAKGSRPEFDVVTGISTGALQATAAFLGPDYDTALKAFNDVENDDIFTSAGTTALITKESIYDTTPLKTMLAKLLDEKTINAVAAEYAKGRQLFIGTTNLDANAFTIWNMGRIASSDRPDRFQVYRDVVLASASFPVAFPPVYFPVTTEQGDTYYQMHVDGGARESIFVFTYLAELEQQFQKIGLNWDEDIDPQIYLLTNGQLFTDHVYQPVQADTFSIALRSIESLSRKNVVASIYYIWSSGLVNGASISLAFIPQAYDLSKLDILEFDRDEMNRLFQFGYQQSVGGSAWMTQQPVEDLNDLEELLDIYEIIEPTTPGTGGEEELKSLSADP